MRYFKRFDKRHPMTKEFFSFDGRILRCILIKYSRDMEILDYELKPTGNQLNGFIGNSEEISKEQFDYAKIILDKLRVILRYSYFNI